MLYLTSGFFGGVSLHAMTIRHYPLGVLFMVLLWLSSIHQSHYCNETAYPMGRLIAFSDRAVARIIWCVILYQNTFHVKRNRYRLVTYLCLLYVPIIYFAKINQRNTPYVPGEHSVILYLNGSMHFISCLGSHLFLMNYKKKMVTGGFEPPMLTRTSLNRIP